MRQGPRRRTTLLLLGLVALLSASAPASTPAPTHPQFRAFQVGGITILWQAAESAVVSNAVTGHTVIDLHGFPQTLTAGESYRVMMMFATTDDLTHREATELFEETAPEVTLDGVPVAMQQMTVRKIPSWNGVRFDRTWGVTYASAGITLERGVHEVAWLNAPFCFVEDGWVEFFPETGTCISELDVEVP